MHRVKRDLRHVEEINDMCCNILPQGSMGLRMLILGTVYFVKPAHLCCMYALGYRLTLKSSKQHPIKYALMSPLNWAAPFKIHTPPVEDLRNISDRGSMNSM